VNRIIGITSQYRLMTAIELHRRPGSHISCILMRRTVWDCGDVTVQSHYHCKTRQTGAVGALQTSNEPPRNQPTRTLLPGDFWRWLVSIFRFTNVSVT